MERFKKIMNKRNVDQFTPVLFDETTFFDFSDGHTNLLPESSKGMERYYTDMQVKYNSLAYIGDKVPGSFRVSGEIHQKFPNAKCVFIIRNIFETACSWQARAERTGDSWPEGRTATHAVKPWNACLNFFLELRKNDPDDFFLVDYEAFFDGDPEDFTELNMLCEFLGLSPDSGMRKNFTNSRNHFATNVKTKERKLDEATLQYINDNADYKAHRLATQRPIDITSKKAA